MHPLGGTGRISELPKLRPGPRLGVRLAAVPGVVPLFAVVRDARPEGEVAGLGRHERVARLGAGLVRRTGVRPRVERARASGESGDVAGSVVGVEAGPEGWPPVRVHVTATRAAEPGLVDARRPVVAGAE